MQYRISSVADALWSQDEEDDDLVSKAKANRKAKLSQNKETTREFLKVRAGPQHMHTYDAQQRHTCD